MNDGTLSDVPEPFPVPIGLRLNQAARAVERAFDEALAEAGGTLPIWLILLNLKIRTPGNQRELAEAVGAREATLTHHLNAMDARGLVTRTRDAANRRIQVVALTDAGEAAFLRLRDTAIAFDTQLRAGLSDTDVARLGELLGQLAANAGSPASHAPPWAGLADGGGAGGRGGRAGGEQRQVAGLDHRGQGDRAGGPGDRRRAVDAQQGLLQVGV